MRSILLLGLAMSVSLHAAPDLGPTPVLKAKKTAAAMKVAAETLIKVVNEEQKKHLLSPMKHEERENFRYTPRDRHGLFFKELDEKQRETVFALLKTAMSEKGLLKSKQVMMLEGVLAKIENRPEFRDPEKYWVAIFGTPGDPKGWAWRFEGHHLSLNFTIVGDEVSLTPSFFGSNPGEVRDGEHKGLRVLADEEDVARELALALIKADKKEVIFTKDPPKEILTKEKSKADPLKPVGVRVIDMNRAQRRLFIKLLDVYFKRYNDELTAKALNEITRLEVEADDGGIHFGWAGSLKKGEAWYYRLQGKTFVMEAANSQNDANHVHAVWRKFDGDFGRDILGDHFKKHDH